jgi:hypothetical protein
MKLPIAVHMAKVMAVHAHDQSCGVHGTMRLVEQAESPPFIGVRSALVIAHLGNFCILICKLKCWTLRNERLVPVEGGGQAVAPIGSGEIST